MANPLPARPSYGLVTETAELTELVDRLIGEGMPVGYDIETSYEGEPRADAQKHPEENFICGFSLTNSLAWARAVPIAFEQGPNIDQDQAARDMWRLAQARGADGLPLLVPHNAKFELRCSARWFAARLGQPLEESYFEVRSDTMIEAYVEAEHESYALKSLTAETFGHQMTEIMELFAQPGGKKLTKFQQDSIQFHLLDQTDQQVIDYMCEDALWALAHHQFRWPKVTSPEFRGRFIFGVDLRQLPILCDMEDTGMAYDWNAMREASQRGQAFMTRLAAEINADVSAQTGKPVSFSLSSPAQVARVLYEDLKLPVRHKTKAGKPSTDKNAIKALVKASPVVQKIQWYRQIKRRCVDNYAGKYEKDYDYAPDGRAHPNIMQCNAVTGRFAFSKPAAQQPPKTKSWELATGETFVFPWRDFITVPPPGSLGDTDNHGWYILGFDLSQAELRWLAGEAGETALIDAFARGDDIHKLTASRIFGKPIDDVTEDERATGKTSNFAIGYQQGVDGLATSLGVPKAEAQQIYDAWFDAYPRIKAWTQRIVRQARVNGYTVSKFGRKHPIWEFAKICDNGHKWTAGQNRCPSCGEFGTPREEYVIAHGERLAGNAPIQGGATGDYMRIAQIRACKALAEAGLTGAVRLFLNVHDSLDAYVRRDVAPSDVIRVLQPAVTFEVKGMPPMVAEWHMGLRMGSLRELEVGPDWSVTVKGAKAEAPVAGDDDDDDDAPVPGNRAAFRSVPARKTPPVPEHDGEICEQASTPDSVPVTRLRPAVGPGSPARTVIVTFGHMPEAAAVRRLRAALDILPGPNTVILRVPQGDVPVPGTSGLTPEHQADVAYLLPGAAVTYDEASVDYAAIADGLTV